MVTELYLSRVWFILTVSCVFHSFLFPFSTTKHSFALEFSPSNRRNSKKDTNKPNRKNIILAFERKKISRVLFCMLYDFSREINGAGWIVYLAGIFSAASAMSINRTYARICGVKSSFHNKKKTQFTHFFRSRPICWYFWWTARVSHITFRRIFNCFLPIFDFNWHFYGFFGVHFEDSSESYGHLRMESFECFAKCKVDNYISVKVLPMELNNVINLSFVNAKGEIVWEGATVNC